MADRFNFWNPQQTDDYRFIDDNIRDYFNIGGVSVFLHKYIGTISQGNLNDPSEPNISQAPVPSLLQIQDEFFNENRDRSYDPFVYELRSVYNMMDTEFDIRQFGIFLESDSYYLSFHLNDTIEKIGRKLIAGDVLEMVHLRDDALLDPNAPAINKFYQITDVNRSAAGWSVTWRPHILRVKIKPLTDSEEFSEILNMPASDQVGGDGLDGTAIPDTGTTIGDLISDFRAKMASSIATVQEAEYLVPYRNFQAGHIWIVPKTETGREHPWIFTGDGIPPNSSVLSKAGTDFPDNPVAGDYFLRTVNPSSHIDVNEGIAQLFQFNGTSWIFQEVDLRLKFSSAHRILQSFINNDNVTTINGERIPERQAISKALLPRALLPDAVVTPNYKG